MTQEKTVLLENIKSELNMLKQRLKNINKFSAEKNIYFTNKNQKLEVRSNLNNKKSENYLKLKNKDPRNPETFELIADILSENMSLTPNFGPVNCQL